LWDKIFNRPQPDEAALKFSVSVNRIALMLHLPRQSNRKLTEGIPKGRRWLRE